MSALDSFTQHAAWREVDELERKLAVAEKERREALEEKFRVERELSAAKEKFDELWDSIQVSV